MAHLFVLKVSKIHLAGSELYVNLKVFFLTVTEGPLLTEAKRTSLDQSFKKQRACVLFAEDNTFLLSPSAVKLKILYSPCGQNKMFLGIVMCIYGKTSFVSCFASLNAIIFHWT